jgi:hypothetical protein
MKVFISWSGAVSRGVAVALRDWLPSVIQAVEPYVSSEDIDPGSRWGAEIAVQLDDTDFGVLCLTRENVTAPWLNFEAGALSKSVERARVVPFLFDLAPSDVPKGPLAQFQAVQPTKAGVLRLVRGMNDFCGALPIERLEGTVEVWWPHLERDLRGIQQQSELAQPVGPQRSTADMLAELLELTRGLQRELQAARATQPIPSLSPTERRDIQREMLWAIMDYARDHGRIVHEMLEGPGDFKIELGGHRAIYVELSLGRNLSDKVYVMRRQMEQKGISDPLLIVHYGAIPERMAEPGPNMRIVGWRNSHDNKALSAVLAELGGAEGPQQVG